MVLDDGLLEALDRYAELARKSRSELIRDSLRAQLRLMANAEADLKVKAGYERFPERLVDVPADSGILQAWEDEDWSKLWREGKSAGTASRRRTRRGQSSSSRARRA
ncbi:MAG: ribbon-helix-helix protein, CopG family [Myxococcales bacterium]|nr:ribbon-helix-helix protein, CopG family [Myxococcales bacterium]